tara:strand:- start:242 stop:487 length:246 start_codon:yes stop_codon:yes gene_type:complete
MALDATNLFKAANAGANSISFYHSTDAIATIVGANYFLGVYDRLRVNDVLLVVGATGGTRTIDAVVVVTVSSTGVTTINGT